MFIIDVTSALSSNKIDYAVVGGLAVVLHGAQRATFDLDLILRLNQKDLMNAEKVFRDLGLVCRLPIDASMLFQFRKEYIDKRNLIAWSFYDPKNPMNVLDIVITHDLSKMKSIIKKAFGKSIKVLSISDLIKMKNESGRPQDLADVEALKILAKG